ncbi:hypothetical protein [Acidovorax sp. LjRoot194]|uniref:hypothetical protein n=1 Tax=Acidovorax sp. LjRoot194 TaxID=3342280 RepID=UPI003ECFC1F1
MTTIIILALTAVVVLSAVVATAWLAAMAGGAAVRMLLPSAHNSSTIYSQQKLAEIDSLIRRTRKAAGLPPIN